MKEGDKAPAFSLKDQNGNTVKLSNFNGKTFLLYFYPKDDTPGCTAEACNLRDNMGKLKIPVIGISMDTAESHKKFSEKYSLTFPLLADDGTVCRKYGVYVQKNMYGRKCWGINRTSFLVKNGKIARIFSKVDTKNHAEQVLGVS